MIVEELEFKAVMEFLDRDLDWISDVAKGPDHYYSIAARNAAKRAQEHLLRLRANANLLKAYIEARDVVFKEVCSGAQVDDSQLNMFSGDV